MKNKVTIRSGDWQRHALVLLFLVTMFLGVQISSGQYFDPNVDDQTYLDKIQAEVQVEVKNTKSELMEEAKIIQGVTRRYIGAKLKENIFKALRILAEKELETISMQGRPRQPRQEEEEGGEEEDAGAAGGADATTRRGLIPQLALILKAIFGSNNVNATRYVESASTFLPKPLANQLVGVASLLGSNRGQTTVAPAIQPAAVPGVVDNYNNTEIIYIYDTTARPRAIITSPVPFVRKPIPQAPLSAIRPPRPGAPVPALPAPARPGEDDDDERENKKARQVKIPGLSYIGNIFKGFRSANVNITTEVPKTTTESLSGFEEETTQPNRMSIAALVDGVRDQIDDLRQNIPDIFQGAREAYKLLETVSGLFERLGDKSPVTQTL